MLTSDPLDHALRRLTHVDEHPELVGDDLREAARLQRRDLAGLPPFQFEPPGPGDAAGAQAQAAPEIHGRLSGHRGRDQLVGGGGTVPTEAPSQHNGFIGREPHARVQS